MIFKIFYQKTGLSCLLLVEEEGRDRVLWKLTHNELFDSEIYKRNVFIEKIKPEAAFLFKNVKTLDFNFFSASMQTIKKCAQEFQLLDNLQPESYPDEIRLQFQRISDTPEAISQFFSENEQ